METPLVICPKCESRKSLEEVLIAQSNQNVIFTCPACNFSKRNIVTSKG
jgi:RNase P subunit RPR2